MKQPSAGEIWKDNDPRGARFVRVTGVGTEFVRLVRVNEDGTAFPGGYKSSSRLERFSITSRNGFTFVRGQ
jgi:hypothetical protein